MTGKRRSSATDAWQRAQVITNTVKILIELIKWLDNDDGPGNPLL